MQDFDPVGFVLGTKMSCIYIDVKLSACPGWLARLHKLLVELEELIYS